MTKHKSADERYEQILGAAQQCFLEKGYFSTRVDEIAKTAGLSKGGVYFHFASKRDIFMALVQQEYDRAMELIDQVTTSDEDVVSKLLTLGEHFTNIFASGNEPKFMVVIGEMSLRDPEVRGHLLGLQNNYIAKIGELLGWGVEQGHLREDIDTESVAILLKALLDGIQVAYAAGMDMDIERLLAAALDLFMRALLEEGALG